VPDGERAAVLQQPWTLRSIARNHPGLLRRTQGRSWTRVPAWHNFELSVVLTMHERGNDARHVQRAACAHRSRPKELS
jgi:hypothetical protein